MNRRFIVTLLAVAIAAISTTAFAMAPVIGYIPSPVIADDTPNTNANVFVYADAMNLDALASDDNTSTTNIVWSYTANGTATSRYRINDRDPIVTLTNDPNNPGTKSLVAGDDPITPKDSNLRTITFRDSTLSPVAGPNTDPHNLQVGPFIEHSEAMTLFASDGSSFSSKSFLAWTESQGTDRLSGTNAAMTSMMAAAAPPATGSLAWLSSTIFGTITITGSTTGLCLNVAAAGPNGGLWTSPYNVVSLVKNNVYRFRLTMDDNTGGDIANGSAPFWDVVIDNFNTASPGTSENKFFGDFQNLDNFTNAGLNPTTLNPNSAGIRNTTPRTFDVWWCPPPINAADWNDVATGEFTTAKDPLNDIRVTFRILDVDTGANNAAVDVGTLCVRTLKIDRVPIDSLSVNSTLYDQGYLTALSHTVGSVFGNAPTANARTTVTFSGGNLTVAPNTGGTYTDGTTGATAWNLEVINVDTGDATVDNNVPATLLDNWPFAWTTGQLLKGTIGVQAPSSQAALNPPDVIQLLWDSPTTELLNSSAIASTVDTLGLPKTSASELVAFFYTHTRTNATLVNGARLRLRAQLLLTQSIRSGDLDTNIGGVTFTRWRVDSMNLPSN